MKNALRAGLVLLLIGGLLAAVGSSPARTKQPNLLLIIS